MQITNQKRIAARLLKCGVNRVYINPYHEQVAGAVQTDDIREFIDEGVIYARPIQEPQGTSKFRAEQKRKGRRKGQGSRKLPQTQETKKEQMDENY